MLWPETFLQTGACCLIAMQCPVLSDTSPYKQKNKKIKSNLVNPTSALRNTLQRKWFRMGLEAFSSNTERKSSSEQMYTNGT